MEGRTPASEPLVRSSFGEAFVRVRRRFAARRGDAGIGPDYLLYGVLQDAADPLGTQLSCRSCRELGSLGFVPGRPNPVRLQLQAHGIELGWLSGEIGQ